MGLNQKLVKVLEQTTPEDFKLMRAAGAITDRIHHLERIQLEQPETAEDLSDEIAKLKVDQQSYTNGFKICGCGYLRRSHMTDGKCPFASTHFKEEP